MGDGSSLCSTPLFNCRGGTAAATSTVSPCMPPHCTLSRCVHSGSFSVKSWKQQCFRQIACESANLSPSWSFQMAQVHDVPPQLTPQEWGSAPAEERAAG